MHWLLIGYMFLFIHRPFEIWPVLGDMYVERVYFLAMTAYWLVYPGKRWLSNGMHLAYFAFAAAVGMTWAMSPWSDQGQVVVENWFKILCFYVLLVTSVRDEKALKRVAIGFMAVMAVYLLHSLREFIGGRHTYRMGIVRMIGVDSSQGDPNSFGASIVFALPFAVAFWRSFPSRSMRLLVAGYVCLSVGCILLTGSRSSLLGVVVWGGYIVYRSPYRMRAFGAVICLAPVVFLTLPESLQTRFETIVNPDAGPESARASGDGRLEGFFKGFELLAANPLNGIGPGAWRPATGSKLESHNLYGQIAGEMGFLGIVAFAVIVYFYWRNLRYVRRRFANDPNRDRDFVYNLSGAIAMGIFLMLFEGNFGHNLFRHNWLWYGGFLIVGRHIVVSRRPKAIPATVQRSRVQAWRVVYS
jgi:O-antigen ligase